MATPSPRPRLRTEFAIHAGWVAEAIADAQLEDRVPPACRGSANPALLSRLADLLDPLAGTRVLDVGCGIGGPAAWLRRERGCDVVGVDVLPEALVGLRGLFPSIPAVVADCDALPFTEGTFDAAWAVGVLDCADGAAILPELARVVRRGGRVAIYTLVAVGPVGPLPAASAPFDLGDLVATITAAGLGVTTAGPAGRLPRVPEAWRDARSFVDRIVRSRHGGEPMFAAVEQERAKVRALLASPAIEAWVLGLRRR